MRKGRKMETPKGMKEEAKALPLFESKQAKGRVAFRVFSCSTFVGICLIWIYRILYLPAPAETLLGRWVWVGMFMAELSFGFYWICTQSLRWNVTHFYPFKHRLSQSYGENLPEVDIFVCTADPVLEPPTMVVNTVLSVMSYNYPTENLAVYLSDDGCSDFTFYALLEASNFAKYWIPFCKTHSVLPLSPEAYFAQDRNLPQIPFAPEWSAVKKLYEDMKKRIESTVERGSISKEIRDQHKGFLEWNEKVTKRDHQSIVQIIIDGRDENAVDCHGNRMPMLVYLAREKRPHYPHHFKAGAMNSLIRVSSVISNGSIILNLDCDMYANDSNTILDSLCFFMDEEKGHEIAFVQYPQAFDNLTKNDLYGNSYEVLNKIELPGMGGYGAAPYCGTGCFHRRETLSGKKYSEGNKLKLSINDVKRKDRRSVDVLEEASKVGASCSYETGTPWGKEMGLVYGCPAEDMITGLAIQCRGWKSIHYSPNRKAYLGVSPNTLEVALIQHRRWCEGMSQIFLSKYCPFIYGHGKIKLGAQIAYSAHLLWAPLSLPTLYYIIVNPFCLLRAIPLFPQASSPWLIPFASVFISKNVYSIAEGLVCGQGIRTWWNLQRMSIFRRTTAHFLGFIDVIIKQIGLSQTTFAITPKVVAEDVLKRYEEEVLEFGSSNIMFTMIATLAMVNLFGLGWVMVKRVIIGWDMDLLIPQVVLCGLIVMLNLPVYQAMFFRSDKGRLPTAITLKAAVLASLSCVMLIN